VIRVTANNFIQFYDGVTRTEVNNTGGIRDMHHRAWASKYSEMGLIEHAAYYLEMERIRRLGDYATVSELRDKLNSMRKELDQYVREQQIIAIQERRYGQAPR